MTESSPLASELSDAPCDVLIVGGGPAGSTAAALLARAGFRVRLFEAERFPPLHVGESLLPFCYDLFQELGVLDRMERDFSRKAGVRFWSADGAFQQTWWFRKVIQDARHLSFHVTRGPFDKALLDNARAAGADIREETSVTHTELAQGPEGVEHVVLTTRNADGAVQRHTARYALDASGRAAVVGRQLGTRVANPGLDRTAFRTHYDVPELRAGLEDQLSLIIYLGGEGRGWSWVFPLTATLLTAGVVVDNRTVAAERDRSEGWQARFLDARLASSPRLAQILDRGRRTLEVQVAGDYSYAVEPNHGPAWAAIGDAARFLDPIFSSGVYLAMKSAQLQARALIQALSRPGHIDQEPIAEARRCIERASAYVFRLIRLFYNADAMAWCGTPELPQATSREGAEDGSAAARHADAMAAAHHMLAGDFFEESHRYGDLLAMLEDPKGFARFKRLVVQPALDR